MTAFEEGVELLKIRNPDRATLRNLLYRYLCIAEASGFYEIIANHIGIIGSDIYKLWPFQRIVVQHKPTGRVVGPNANRIFRNLTERAEQAGLVRAAKVLSEVFDDDLRNAIAHADFVMWPDGLRLRKRNGGLPKLLTWAEVNLIVRRGFGFVDLLKQHVRGSMVGTRMEKLWLGEVARIRSPSLGLSNTRLRMAPSQFRALQQVETPARSLKRPKY